MREFDVIIIGGGASGLYSAINLLDAKLSVCIIEANERIGKKILASGNGKCNILNNSITVKNYNNDFLKQAIQKYTHDYLTSFLKQLDIILKADQEGREYPYSESANTVLNLIRKKLDGKVYIHTGEKVEKIIKEHQYIVKTDKQSYAAKYIIFATGTNATSGINSHAILGDFGHKSTKIYPALVPIKIDRLKGCSGLRSKVKASLYINEKLIMQEEGEVLFKDNALSGILAFKMSSHIARALVKDQLNQVDIYLDFVPTISKEQLIEFSKDHSFEGLVHKAIYLLVKEDVTMIKSFPIKYVDLMKRENAQILSGGIQLNELDENSCESKLTRNLFIIGEVLDIDGECGGYNLTAALITALMASDCIKARC